MGVGSRVFVLVASALAGILGIGGGASAGQATCTVAGLSALSVAKVTISSATARMGSNLAPDYCDVLGSVATSGEGAPPGSARFELKLPASWNRKFLFWGVGGFAGSLYPSVTRTDMVVATTKGYATAITDTGHQAPGTDASWALIKPGVPDQAKLADYYFRAIHDVTLAAKLLTQRYYGVSGVSRSYFDGCSNGGREGLMEATRYPDDYDGIVAGAPFMDMRTILAGASAYQHLLSRVAYIPSTSLPAIDRVVHESCDGADGVKDGLIQNPGKCAPDPKLFECASAHSADCLSPTQVATLQTYGTAIRDEAGHVVYPGSSIADLHGGGMDVWLVGSSAPKDFAANEPWGSLAQGKSPLDWQFVDSMMKYVVERDPGFDVRNIKIDPAGVVSAAALSQFNARTEAGDADRPKDLARFIAAGKKLLMYHGFSDPALSPYRTIMYYEDAASELPGKYQQLQDNVRLFMVPDMMQCAGGPGPNAFDTLSALESWVEQGTPPESIAASHYADNNPSQPIDRTMPLCPFPAAAKYKGGGDVKDGANWNCAANQDLLDSGPAGKRAGLR
jgi:feruloyl esterase